VRNMSGHVEYKLTTKQAAVMRIASRIGPAIARDCPGIAQDYRSGTLSAVIRDYGIMEKYGLPEGIALASVYHAISLLIPEVEMKGLGRLHVSENGQRMAEEGRGMFAFTPEQLLESCRKGGNALTHEQRIENGKKGGTVTYNLGLGVHNQTREQLKKNGRLAAVSRGLVPWSDGEELCLIELSKIPEYQHTELNVGEPNYKAISGELMRRFRIPRTPKGIESKMRRLRARQRQPPK